MHNDHTPEELQEAVREIIVERIPFNRMLGVELEECDTEHAVVRLDMRPEFVGNYVRGVMHGGVISSVLDVTGGLVALLGVIERTRSGKLAEKLARFERLGTIDLRVDFLRPGDGDYYLAKGYLLRTGSRVAVTRMELHNDAGVLIAVGTGAYVVS
ncbi:MAG: thioesterase family protein [Gammaproteobacteria bacterium]|nr:thioesterase family protein [Gammaproteobacteria bacterium]